MKIEFDPQPWILFLKGKTKVYRLIKPFMQAKRLDKLHTVMYEVSFCMVNPVYIPR